MGPRRIHMCRDSFICGMAHSDVIGHVWRCVCVTLCMCDVVYVWRCVCVTLLINMVAWLTHLCHDSFSCDVLRSYDPTHSYGDMTNSYVTWLIHMWYDSLIRMWCDYMTCLMHVGPRPIHMGPRPIHMCRDAFMCGMAHSDVTCCVNVWHDALRWWRDSFVRAMIHSCYVSFICLLGPFIRDVTHSYVWHDSFVRVTWLIHMCDRTHPYVWNDSFMCVWLDSCTCATWLIHMCVLWYIHTCLIATVIRSTLSCVTWLIYMVA